MPHSWSSIGFGTAQFDAAVLPQAADALRNSLEAGVNWIDTAPDFGRGRALASLKQLLPDTDPDRCAILLKTPVRHSLEPAALLAELESAQNELGSQRPWYLVLRDPEFLQTEMNSHQLQERLQTAFKTLGEWTAQGRIRGFGVSSQGFSLENEQPGFFSLEATWEAAQQALGENPRTQGFEVLQAPFNLLEPGIIALANCNLATPAEFASKRGLKLLTYRPLHAWNGTYFTRLADFPHRGLDDSFVEGMRTHLAEVLRLEAPTMAQTGIGYRIRRASSSGPSPLGWSSFLRWDFQPAWEKLPRPLPEGYETAVEDLLRDYTAWIEEEASQRALEIRTKLLEASPDLSPTENLASLSLRLILSLPMITGVACGLTQPMHVQATLAAARAPRLKPAHAIRCFQFVDIGGETTP